MSFTVSGKVLLVVVIIVIASLGGGALGGYTYGQMVSKLEYQNTISSVTQERDTANSQVIQLTTANKALQANNSLLKQTTTQLQQQNSILQTNNNLLTAQNNALKAENAIPKSTLTPSLTLLGAGAQWAANGGDHALYVNWIDYSSAHPGDPNDFNPPPNATKLVSSVISALNVNGLIVDRASDIPSDLSKYNVVIIDCYWSCNPFDSQILSNYILKGGGVVLIGGTPPYFVVNNKTTHPLQNDLTNIADWLGASSYYNSEGQAVITVNNPLGTSLQINQTVFTGPWSQAAVFDLRPGATPIAVWAEGGVFAYTYVYGGGRVYYQASNDLDSYP